MPITPIQWLFCIKGKYINPLELFSQFGPLLSLAIRLFGSSFAFAVILNLIPIILTGIGLESLAATWPLFGAFYQWILIAVDLGFSFLQAYVFFVLTLMYWKQELPEHDKKRKARAQARYEKIMKRQNASRDKTQQREDRIIAELLGRTEMPKEKKQSVEWYQNFKQLQIFNWWRVE